MMSSGMSALWRWTCSATRRDLVVGEAPERVLHHLEVAVEVAGPGLVGERGEELRCAVGGEERAGAVAGRRARRPTSPRGRRAVVARSCDRVGDERAGESRPRRRPWRRSRAWPGPWRPGGGVGQVVGEHLVRVGPADLAARWRTARADDAVGELDRRRRPPTRSGSRQGRRGSGIDTEATDLSDHRETTVSAFAATVAVLHACVQNQPHASACTAGRMRARRRRYGEAAQQLGSALAHRGIGLVYGGGHVGLMGAGRRRGACRRRRGDRRDHRATRARRGRPRSAHRAGGRADDARAQGAADRAGRRLHRAAGRVRHRRRVRRGADLEPARPHRQARRAPRRRRLLGPAVRLDVQRREAGFVRDSHRMLAQRAHTVDEAIALATGPVPDVGHKWIDRDVTPPPGVPRSPSS